MGIKNPHLFPDIHHLRVDPVRRSGAQLCDIQLSENGERTDSTLLSTMWCAVPGCRSCRLAPAIHSPLAHCHPSGCSRSITRTRHDVLPYSQQCCFISPCAVRRPVHVRRVGVVAHLPHMPLGRARHGPSASTRTGAPRLEHHPMRLTSMVGARRQGHKLPLRVAWRTPLRRRRHAAGPMSSAAWAGLAARCGGRRD